MSIVDKSVYVQLYFFFYMLEVKPDALGIIGLKPVGIHHQIPFSIICLKILSELIYYPGTAVIASDIGNGIIAAVFKRRSDFCSYSGQIFCYIISVFQKP